MVEVSIEYVEATEELAVVAEGAAVICEMLADDASRHEALELVAYALDRAVRDLHVAEESSVTHPASSSIDVSSS